jgi:hypothetical protein
VLKPGGHLLAFGGARTYHRLACAVEDAGFEIRDQIMWVYGSGFPKSLDVSKAIDKAAGAEREVVGNTATCSGRTIGAGTSGGYHGDIVSGHCRDITAPATPDAERWQGWGTALKPAHEPIALARKPLVGTVAANVLAHGTGALNVDGCRVSYDDGDDTLRFRTPGNGEAGKHVYSGGWRGEYSGPAQPHPDSARHDARGRWPANLIHDGSDEALAHFPEVLPSHPMRSPSGGIKSDCGYSGGWGPFRQGGYYDSGSAARFFYCAKASRAERDEGLEGLPEEPLHWSAGTQNPGSFQSPNTHRAARNHHPTV